MLSAKHAPPPLCLLLFLGSIVCSAQKPELVLQNGHTSNIGSVAFSQDGRLLASAGGDGVIRLWDFKSGRELRALDSKVESPVGSVVTFSPDGRVVAAGVNDTIKLWDVRRGGGLATYSLGPAGETGWSPADIAFTGDGEQIVSVSNTGEIYIRSVGFPFKRSIKLSVGDFIDGVDLSPDGKRVAAALRGGNIMVFAAFGGRRLLVITGHPSSITSLTFSPDGKTLASAGRDNTVRLWDAQTGLELHTISEGAVGVNSLVFSPDGARLVGLGKGGTLRQWSTAGGRELPALAEDAGDTYPVAFSPDGAALVGVQHNSIRVRDAQSGRELRALIGRVNYVRSGVFSADGRTLALGTGNWIQLWDTHGSREIRTLTGLTSHVTNALFSPDGRTIVGLSGEGEAKLWDVGSGKELFTVIGHPDGVNSVAFTPDSKTLVSAGSADVGTDGLVKLWDVAGSRELRTLRGHTRGVQSVAFSPDGAMLASADVREEELILWDVAGGRPLHTIEGFGSVAFSPDGRMLLNWSITRAALIDVRSGSVIRPLTNPPRGFLKRLSFSPDGKTIAGASSLEGSYVNVWDVGTGRLLESMEGTFENGEKVRRSVPDFDDGFLVSGSTVVNLRAGGGVRLYDRVTYTEAGEVQELCNLIAMGERDWLVTTPGGLFDGSPAAWPHLIWRFDNNTFDFAPVEVFFNDFYHPGLLQEVFRGRRPAPPGGRGIAAVDRRQPAVNLSLTSLQAPAQPLTQRTVTLKVEVADNKNKPRLATHPPTSGARDVRLFRNGSLVKVWRGDLLKGRRSVTLEVSVQLFAGENQFTAYAFNRDNVKSLDAALAVMGAEILKRAGTLRILTVGVDAYSNPRYDLRYAVADARAFGAEVKRQQERLGQFARVELTPLYDREATKANVMRALAGLAGRVQPEDAVIFYFAGHGVAEGKRFYLLPHDLGYKGPRDALNTASLRQILQHGISDRELEVAFEGLDAGQILFVVDACNSGQALEAEEKRRGPMNSKGLAQLAYEKGMYVLTASQSLQVANEEPVLGHGYLTYVLVEEGLRGGAADAEPADGMVYLREWFRHAEERVPRLHEERMAQRSEEEVAALRSRKVRELKLSGVEDVQRPRVFYRRELEAQPLIIARSGTTSPVK